MQVENRPSYIPSHEPNEFEFEHAGFKCAMRRNHSQAWCGYVLLPETHPYHGVEMLSDEADSLEVHGGITFAENVVGRGFVLGFDCAHSGDRVSYIPHHSCDVYRTFEYAKAETAKLAEQLREMQDANN